MSEDSGILKAIKLTTIIILFASFLLFFLQIKLWDYDFWWHVATGKYIVTHLDLPDKDPFSFTSSLKENENFLPVWENFVLKQSWLAQPLFYKIYYSFGPKGIIILRSMFMVCTLAIAFRRMIRSGAGFIISLVFVILLFGVLSCASGERPVLFSFLFTALLLSFLEDFRESPDKKLFLIVPLMLLWANTHGGFIVGDVIIMVYMAGEGVKILLKKNSLARRQETVFYSAASVALFASFINPAGWDAFIIKMAPKYKILFENVQEWQSPLFFWVNNIWDIKYSYGAYSYIILALIFPVILIARNRRLDVTHVVLLSGMLAVSLGSLRFVIFYAVAAVMVLARESDALMNSLSRKRLAEHALLKIEWGLTLIVLFSVMLFAAGLLNTGKLKFGVAKRATVPERAANFIEENKIQGNMFNDSGYGGYLLWRLYPWKQNFLDTRTLNVKIIKDYDIILNANNFGGAIGQQLSGARASLWQMLLDHYKINFIVMAPFDLYGVVYPLIFELVENDKWTPVYCDSISIVFVRNIEQNRELIDRFRLPKDNIYNSLVGELSSLAMRNSVNPRYLVSLGDVFGKMGRKKDALTAYKYALKRDPIPGTKNKIDLLESELRKADSPL